MAFPVYRTRFLAWHAEESPPSYEVPAGYVAIVRDLDVYSGGGAIINWQLAVNDLAVFAAGQFTIEALGQTGQWRGRQVVHAGEFLAFSSDGSTDGMCSGYLLSLP